MSAGSKYLRRGQSRGRGQGGRQPDYQPMRPSHRATDGCRARGQTSHWHSRSFPRSRRCFTGANCAGPWSVFCASSCAQVSLLHNLHPAAEGLLVDQGAAVTLSFGLSSLVFLASYFPARALPDSSWRWSARRWTITYCLAGSGLPGLPGDGDSASRWGRRDCRVCRRSADYRLHRPVDLPRRARLPLRAVSTSPGAVAGNISAQATGRVAAGVLAAVPVGAGILVRPSVFFGTLLVVALIGAFVPVLFWQGKLSASLKQSPRAIPDKRSSFHQAKNALHYQV